MHKDNKIFCLCETDLAHFSICATRFNQDEVYARTSLCDTKENLFTADRYEAIVFGVFSKCNI